MGFLLKRKKDVEYETKQTNIVKEMLIWSLQYMHVKNIFNIGTIEMCHKGSRWDIMKTKVHFGEGGVCRKRFNMIRKCNPTKRGDSGQFLEKEAYSWNSVFLPKCTLAKINLFSCLKPFTLINDHAILPCLSKHDQDYGYTVFPLILGIFVLHKLVWW